jgi:hypothetical protein
MRGSIFAVSKSIALSSNEYSEFTDQSATCRAH